jgi:hypothetical protein
VPCWLLESSGRARGVDQPQVSLSRTHTIGGRTSVYGTVEHTAETDFGDA